MGIFQRVFLGAPRRGRSASRIGGGEVIARARAEPLPQHRAVAGLVALVLLGLPVAALGSRIGMQDHAAAEPAKAETTDTEARGFEFLVTPEAREVDTEELLEHILVQFRCMAFQQRFGEKSGAGPGLGHSDFSESELAALFEPPAVYRSGVEAERLGALAARIVGTDRSGTLDGSRAAVKGLPPPLAVSGWGRPGTPLIAYVPRAETPFDLARDMNGAGALVVDGDLNVWGSFHYLGLLVVLGKLTVMEDAELSVNGLPLFAGELKVLHRGNLRLIARDTELAFIRSTLGGRVPLRHLPLPQIERVERPTDEQDCPFFIFGR